MSEFTDEMMDLFNEAVSIYDWNTGTILWGGRSDNALAFESLHWCKEDNYYWAV